MRSSLSIALVPLFAAGLFLAGCDQPDSPAERAGEQIEESVEQVGDTVGDAADDAEEAGDEIR